MEIEQLVAWLGVPHRAKDAYRALLARGEEALPAIRQGLLAESASVRRHCCALLDHLVRPDCFDDLLAMLDDPDAAVRVIALHALACDRCKEGEWCPSPERVLPPAQARLRQDPDYHVRAMAVEVVGRFALQRPEAREALQMAHTADTHPMVRKKAGWYLPGGPIYRRASCK